MKKLSKRAIVFIYLKNVSINVKTIIEAKLHALLKCLNI